MPVEALRWIRKMRGGSQAHLMVASDGHHYVVKFKQNAQHRRVLVNEMVAACLLNYLEIPTAAVEIVSCSESFLQANPEIAITLGSRREPVLPGWHFGSRLPVNPDRFAIYDYLPDALLRQVANLRDFIGVLVFDKWVSNLDSRQCVLFRAQIRDWMAGDHGPKKTAFVAMMIDHGYIFGGPAWKLEDAPLAGLYGRPLVYETIEGLESFEPWLTRVLEFPAEILDHAFRKVPECWLNGDREELERLLEQLYRRRKRVPHLLEDCRIACAKPFPNWR
ncbi:MAG: hypothetical protein NZV14_12480 [Bryobacteraceae bacterium]|nr:hypothetical protein [Bryobacteraceae bacterium]MDW8378970.1 hypothetical protein [Bryobacterales bacterium]